MLMNAVVVRRTVMQYRGQDLQYSDVMDLDADVQDKSSAKQYRQAKRPQRSSRRRGSKSSASHPGYGIAGRRNHRWAW